MMWASPNDVVPACADTNEKPQRFCVEVFGSPQQFRTFDDSDDFRGLFLNK